jgi:hypothetical protein
MVLALAAGCMVGGGTPPGDTGGPSPATTGETGAPALTFGRVEVQEATDFCVDWSAVTVDADGAQVAASAFTLWLFDVAMDEASVLASSQAELFSQPRSNPWFFDNSVGRTSACASETQVIGNPFLPEEFVGDAARTWVLWLSASNGWFETGDPMLADLTLPTLVVPVPTSTNHTIVLTDPAP